MPSRFMGQVVEVGAVSVQHVLGDDFVHQKLEQRPDAGWAGYEVVRELPGLCQQGTVQGGVLSQVGVVGARQDGLFADEVLFNFSQQHVNDLAGFIGGAGRDQGIEQIIGQRKQDLVLAIDRTVAAGIGRTPGDPDEISGRLAQQGSGTCAGGDLDAVPAVGLGLIKRAVGTLEPLLPAFLVETFGNAGADGEGAAFGKTGVGNFFPQAFGQQMGGFE